MPLQNRYETLDLESQPDDLKDLEGNYLPSEPPNYDLSVRWIFTSNIRKRRRAGSDEIEKRSVKVIKRDFRALGQVVDKTGAQVVFCSVPWVAEKNDERNRRTHIINKWLKGIETNEDGVECLWVRIKGKANKADILLGVCYRPPNQEEEVDNLFYKQLKNVSAPTALVLVGDFNLPDICWELNTAEKRQIIKKCFDKYINGKRKGKANLCSLLDEGENIVTGDEEKAEVLNAFSASVFTRKTTCLQDNCSLGLIDAVREQNGPPIRKKSEAVRQLLRCLDTRKSMGPDGIHPSVMRELADEFAKPLSIIYQQSWLTGEVPDDWKLANVTPIHKKGGREDPSNYRPVSLTSVPGKTM
ncbi:hypothetical protein DUI87_16482 [Hirundo rustica rustica]|uniref:Endonuclease/exonuclease/phosphatase domain-containing protein n=1 Tax=Hirundo rustica rustica TaxID=333673 RepID=A0A3M0K157_HIRRU|nr:hypothetical protein DUI87_16482 [Hirundo rustica rustica]